MRKSKFALHTISRGLIVAGIMALARFLSGCDLPDPAAPSWDIDLNIPLINKRYYLSEFVEDTDELYADSLGNLTFEFDSELDTVFVAEHLSINGFEEQFNQAVGSFKVPVPETRGVTITLGEMYPPANNLNGLTAPIPGFQFDIPNRTFEGFESFAWVEIAKGTIDLTIENRLPFSLGRPIEVVVEDLQNGILVARFTFADLIASGTSQTRSVSLAGKRVGSNLRVSVKGATPGSDGPVVVDAGAGFTVNIAVSDLEVSGAAAKIDPIRVELDSALVISDSLVVTRAQLRSGAIDLSIGGDLPVASRIYLQLPDFREANGQGLERTLEIPARGQQSLRIVLDGLRFEPQPGEFGEQKIRFLWRIETLQSPDQIVEIHASNFLAADFEVTELLFSEISGKFFSKGIDVPRQSFSVDIPSELDSLRLLDAALLIKLQNTIRFPARLRLKVLGRNDAGEQALLEIEEDILPGEANGDAGETLIRLTGQNSNIVDFLNILPTRVEFWGEVDVGDENWVGTIRDVDYVNGVAFFSAPLAFQLPHQSFDSETSEIEVEDESQERIRENAMEGELMINMLSHVPLGGSVSFQFAITDSAVFEKPDLRLGPFTLKSGVVDPATGTVAGAVASEIDIALDKQKIDFFARDSFFVGVQILFPGTDGQVVRLREDDYLDVQALLRFKARIQEDTSN